MYLTLRRHCTFWPWPIGYKTFTYPIHMSITFVLYIKFYSASTFGIFKFTTGTNTIAYYSEKENLLYHMTSRLGVR